MSDFKPIETYRNWCDYDRLDGVDLWNGEPLLLKMPDGTERECTVVLKESSYRISDMGSPYDVPVKTAYVEVPVNGAVAKMRLAGQGILAKRLIG